MWPLFRFHLQQAIGGTGRNRISKKSIGEGSGFSQSNLHLFSFYIFHPVTKWAMDMGQNVLNLLRHFPHIVQLKWSLPQIFYLVTQNNGLSNFTVTKNYRSYYCFRCFAARDTIVRIMQQCRYKSQNSELWHILVRFALHHPKLNRLKQALVAAHENIKWDYSKTLTTWKLVNVPFGCSHAFYFTHRENCC